MLSHHLTKEPAQNQTVTVTATVWILKILPDTDFPEQIRLDTFFVWTSLCGAKLKNHYLLRTVLTSQQRPVHSDSIDEGQKNSLLCMMKKNLCNHLHFPPSVRTLLFSDNHANPVIVCGRLWIYFFLICTEEINAVPSICLPLHPVR